MKTLIFICLCVSALCRPVAAVPYSLASREVLRDMPGEVSRLLGEAIDQQSIKDVRTHASALIRSGNAQLVVNLLSYPSGLVHRGAIEALVDTNCREALPALLDYLWKLQFLAVMGGTEEQGERARLRTYMEHELARMTGLEADPAWTSEQLQEKLRERAGVPAYVLTPGTNEAVAEQTGARIAEVESGTPLAAVKPLWQHLWPWVVAGILIAAGGWWWKRGTKAADAP